MIDKDVSIFGGQVGILNDAGWSPAKARSSLLVWIPVGTIVPSLVLLFMQRFRSDRDTELLATDMDLARSLAIPEFRAYGAIVILAAICLGCAAWVWTEENPRLNASAFSLEFALLPILPVMLYRRIRKPIVLIFAFTILYVFIMFVARFLFDGNMGTVERTLIGLSLIYIGLRHSAH